MYPSTKLFLCHVKYEMTSTIIALSYFSPCVGMFLCFILHEVAVGVYFLYVATWLDGSLFYLEVAIGVYSLYVATWLASSLFYLNENNTNAMCVCWSTRLKSWSY
jgi:hypothetical protein